ncbi:hypothetical protein [Frankia sp. R82]|uniref:hypothetical protein n=1 Tax=Frankia sp. R82 TaxID=2950553 RepID=UPI0020441C1F|nr:hypothetical protein [Frankia sp. R82]MCM3885379.1 hypothetical protein [Frankia sp. R82]
MPQLVTVRIGRPNGRPIRIWVPVLPLVLALSPLLVLAVPAAVVACLRYRVSAVQALSTGWRVVGALPGARFDLEQGRTAVHVAIR